MIFMIFSYVVYLVGFVVCDLRGGDAAAILYAMAFYPAFLILYGGVKK